MSSPATAPALETSSVPAAPAPPCGDVVGEPGHRASPEPIVTPGATTALILEGAS